VPQQTHGIRLRAKFRLDLFILSPSVGDKPQFLPAALRAAQRADISVTQRSILRFFAPQGRHVAPTRVKFGTEAPSSVPNLTPVGATVKV